jgi:ribosomal protein S18 acetylase RimI-like enzyme
MTNYRIAFMRPEHIKEVSSVDTLCHENPWPIAWFASEVADKELALVAISDDTVAGYVIARCDAKGDVWLTRLGTHPKHRRHGVASRLVDNVIRYAEDGPVRINVRESNLPAQLFLRYKGFKASRTLRRAAKCPTENIYVFEHAYVGA